MSDSGNEESSSTPTPTTTAPHLGNGDYQPLVPLRVDVSLAGTNKASPSTPSLRIVETILLDPWVWPLKPKKLNDQTEWIEDNARYLAHNLLTDLEVQGMGRTVRHFTNRSDIWSIELQKKVMDQLRPQLQIVADMRQNQRKRRRDETLVLRVEDDSTKKSGTSKVKQEENKMYDSNVKKETDSETKPQSTVTSEGVASSSTRLAGEKSVTEESSASKDPAEKKSGEASLSHLIPIQIRLSVHGIRVHDDCWWDPFMSSKVSPLDYAQSLGRDLNLSAEAIQSVAIDIAEQLYGSPRNGQIPSDLAIVDEGSVAQPNTRTAAVWSMDQRTHISHVAHLVAQHRQP